MRKLLLFAATALACVLTTTAYATPRGDLAACISSRDSSVVIATCTRVLNLMDSAMDWPHNPTLTHDRATILTRRCWSYADKDDYTHAAADCTDAVRLDPESVEARRGLGNANHSLGNFDRAMSDFDAVLQMNPKYGPAFANRAQLWLDKKDFDRALSDANEAVQLDPRLETYHVRAMVWQARGDYERALADASTAIALMPKAPSTYALRGTIWRLKGNLTQALQDQDKAVQLDPKSAIVRLDRADTYRYMGDSKRALSEYDSALEIYPPYIAAHAGKGLTYEKMGDAARARAEFQAALSSSDPVRSEVNLSALETARAGLAALDSGAALPVIPAVPANVTSATSIPTPQAVVPAAVARPQAKQGRRVALVIGNSGYVNVPALPNPAHDAAKIAATLRAVGFDTVTLETDDNREKLTNALRNFAHEAEKADWAVVYYAGHGIEMGGVNYLVPIDAKFATDHDVQFEAIPFDQVMASLEGAKKLKLVLLDACRDNPFAPQMRNTPAPSAVAAPSTAGAPVGTRSIGRGLGEVKVSGATLVVYAAKQGEVALDGDGGNSPFAVAVVQRIATPGVEINKVFRLVRDDVMEATAGRQEPFTYGSLPGSEDFFFVANK